MADNPLVSVVMTVYNCETYLRQSINSILKQSYPYFEFIIVIEYGCTDKTIDIIRFYNDCRIRTLYNESKLGIAASVNRGMREARGKYIARMDSDDISLMNRLAIQVKYLERNPDIAMTGTNQYLFCDGKVTDIFCYPLNSKDIKFSSYSYCVFGQSTIMFRRKDFIENNLFYSADFQSEDVELYSRVVKKFKTHNSAIPLLLYRMHNDSSSSVNRKENIDSWYRTQKREWENSGIRYRLSNAITISMSKAEIKIKVNMYKQLISKLKHVYVPTVCAIYKQYYDYPMREYFRNFSYLYSHGTVVPCLILRISNRIKKFYVSLLVIYANIKYKYLL